MQLSIHYVTGPTIERGQSLQLQCRGKTVLAPVYYWKFKDRLICDSSQPIDRSSRFRCPNNDLVLPFVDAADDGHYFCLVPGVGKSPLATVTVTGTTDTPRVMMPTPATSRPKSVGTYTCSEV